MFYDVLISLARVNFEVKFNREKIAERKKVMDLEKSMKDVQDNNVIFDFEEH